MKIDLQFPFNKDYISGYKVFSQGRYNIILREKISKKLTTTSFARYLMSVKLKRYLSENEHVDHINNKKTDDRIENLQILTQQQNNLKHAKEIVGGRKYLQVKCPVCNNVFDRPENQFLNKRFIVCNRTCLSIALKYPELQQKIILKEFRK